MPGILVPTGAKPTASAASMTAPYRVVARPFEFFMFVPSSGTVEPVNLLERQTSQLATHGMFLCEAIPLQSTTVRLTQECYCIKGAGKKTRGGTLVTP